MLDRLTAASFAPLVGDAFRAVPARGEPLDLVLSACEETRYGSPEEWARTVRRVPFSLLFHAADGRHLDQQVFTLHHAGLGEVDLLLVPLGPDAGGMRYEAVVS